MTDLELVGTPSAYHDEEQLTLWPIEAGAHELLRVSSVGTWWRGLCSCGHLTPILPARWRVDRAHGEHRRWQTMPLDDPHRVRRA